MLRKAGFAAVRSSVHVNFGPPHFDKLSACMTVVRQVLGGDANDLSQYVFVGDALNDAPMFGGFPTSVGVANIKAWWDELAYKPAYLTERPEGAGLRELVAAPARSLVSTGRWRCLRLDVFAAALRALDGGRGVAIAAVIGAHGSTPRHLGARMAVAADGEQWGTVGGGKIEQLVVAAAREVAGGPRRASCASTSCAISRCAAAARWRSRSRRRQRRARRSRSWPARARDTCSSRRSMADRSSCASRREGDPRAHQPTSTGRRLVERVGAAERAIVFGLGHVARSLGPLLDGLGFR